MTRVAINGFGRIGRQVARRLLGVPALELVAINDLAPIDQLAHLLTYDSVHGRLESQATVEEGHLHLQGRSVRVFAQPKPSALP